jgi:hypothetical protein
MLLNQVKLSDYKKEDFRRVSSYIDFVKYPVINELIKNPDLRDLIAFFYIGLEEMCAQEGYAIPAEVKQQIGTTISTALLYGIMAGEAKKSSDPDFETFPVVQ